jgi:hypothetical protein
MAHIAKCKVALHYVMDGFRRYVHARVQALAKNFVFHFAEMYFAVSLQYILAISFYFKVPMRQFFL